jgi:hypothetical protein
MPKGFPFSVGFRVLFEKGAFELETVLEGVGCTKRQEYSLPKIPSIFPRRMKPLEYGQCV